MSARSLAGASVRIARDLRDRPQVLLTERLSKGELPRVLAVARAPAGNLVGGMLLQARDVVVERGLLGELAGVTQTPSGPEESLHSLAGLDRLLLSDAHEDLLLLN